MIVFLLLLQAASAHHAVHYDITLIPSDTSDHILAEVKTTWRLGSTAPVTMELDSSMRVIRVLVDGKENTRLSRTMYARSSTEVDVPHQKQPGDSLTTQVRYRGFPHAGLLTRTNAEGTRTVTADNRPGQAHYWLPVPKLPQDKVTVAFHIQVPLDYRVTAAGTPGKPDTLAYGHLMRHFTLDQPVRVDNLAVEWVGGHPSAK
jgi:hypothetical protein